MRRLLAWAAGVATLLALLVPSGGTAAYPLKGCNVTVTSLDASGAQIDTATGPGTGGTASDPFDVTWGGTVRYVGDTGSQVIKKHHWGVAVYGLPLFSGGHPNDAGDISGSGDLPVKLPEGLPDFLKATGIFYVSGQIDGEGGTHCDGSGWVRLNGDPLGTIPFWVGVGALLLGGVTLWSALPSLKSK